MAGPPAGWHSQLERAGHFHTPEELEDEITAAGFAEVSVVGLERPAELALEVTGDPTDDDYAAAMRLARAFESSPTTRDLSSATYSPLDASDRARAASARACR
ncbi:hypothetical protein [Leekyejoonella antrihumi]|uniref:Uncharacterized protein n=1 Tax=Leekyejoonella antrihumi TaxID=1660198 RepID=A0A563E8M8_9MICO|nr:hypothetical protein [Leekyejoonella antrihumi]TWP38603.1 hypothetical protein FGL98_02115 [Leekyejoonella antrihumi]